MKENVFKVTDNLKGSANFWRSYQVILDEKNEQTGFVKCKFCNRLDKYDTYKGTKDLKLHANQCNALTKTSSILTYAKKTVCITKEEKTQLTKAALQLCYKDIRPFTAIQGKGQMALLLAVSKLSSKYGQLSEEELKEFLPCANTVNNI